MKQNLLNLIMLASRFGFYIRLLPIICLSAGLATGLRAQENASVRVIEINMDLEEASIKKAFAEIEKATNLRFSYDEKIVNPEIKISFKGKGVVSDILMEISAKARLHFKQINQNIHVRPLEESTIPEIDILGNEVGITGRVTNVAGEGLPGVSVIVQGTSIGTLTDINGNYQLIVPEDAALVYSFIGFRTLTEELNNRTEINLTLTEDVTELHEVVVIGYGQRERQDLTGAISSIHSDDVNLAMGLSPEQSMIGRMAGVSVASVGGNPNARPEIQIRGVSTLGNTSPLYVIDGVPITEAGEQPSYSIDVNRADDNRGPINILNMINPADIESISVLKDASAAAIYGVRAANGVILITTRRGKEGKPIINFNASHGLGNISQTYEVLDTQDYTALIVEAFKNVGRLDELPLLYESTSDEYLGDSPTYNRQLELINKNAVNQNYDLSVSGGNEFSNYYVGTGFSKVESTTKLSETDRYTFTANSDHSVTKWLRFGQSARFSYMDVMDEISNLNTAFQTPWQPFYLDDGSFAPYRKYLRTNDEGVREFSAPIYGTESSFNTLAIKAFTDNEFELWRFLGSAYAELQPMKGFHIKASLSYDWYLNSQFQFINRENEFYRANSYIGHQVTERNTKNNNLLKEITGNYTKAFGEHNFNLLLGLSAQEYGAKTTLVQDKDVKNVSRKEYRRIAEGSENKYVDSFEENYGLIGYIGRISYKYANKYYADATVRRDGTSRFSPNNRWGVFPSFAAAWRISSEPFMEGISLINDLKMRVGWGQLGNQSVRAYAWTSLLNLNPRYGLGGVIKNGVYLSSLAIEDISWETTTTTTLGFDALLLNNRLNLSLDYYSRFTEDILQEAALPLVAGVKNDAVLNIGEMRNVGVELSANYSFPIKDNVRLSVGGNITTVKNRVEKLYESKELSLEGNRRISEGMPYGYIYGYKTGGIFRTSQELNLYHEKIVDEIAVSQTLGDLYFRDLGSPDGEGGVINEADGKITEADRTILGKTIPGYYYGLYMDASFHGFDISVLFRGVGDVQQYNFERERGESMSNYLNQLNTVRDRWTHDNPTSSMPRAAFGDPGRNARVSDRFVDDAGFFRLQNIQLGYNFKVRRFEALRESKLKLYIGATNMFTITKWSGLDPEQNLNPTPRTYVMGLNLSF